MSDEPKLQAHELDHFTGSENLYRHPINAKAVYTDGAKYLADRAGAYWLLDEIALAQSKPSLAAEGFQVWTLVVHPDCTANLTCDDGDGNILLRKCIPTTDFPLSEVKLYFTGGTIMLPSEC